MENISEANSLGSRRDSIMPKYRFPVLHQVKPTSLKEPIRFVGRPVKTRNRFVKVGKNQHRLGIKTTMMDAQGYTWLAAAVTYDVPYRYGTKYGTAGCPLHRSTPYLAGTERLRTAMVRNGVRYREWLVRHRAAYRTGMARCLVRPRTAYPIGTGRSTLKQGVLCYVLESTLAG